MALALTWAPTARQDFWELVSYIAATNPRAARDFARRLLDTVARLHDFPRSGRIVPECNDPTLREIIRSPCRIIYRVRDQVGIVEVVRIWHAARGVPEP